MIEINEKYDLLWSGTTRYYLITGGRGGSKSFPVNLFAENLTWEEGHKILFTRYTLTTAHISVIPEFKEKIDLHSSSEHFDITKAEITNKHTQSQIIFRGIKTASGNQTANLKSIQGITTWICDEAEEIPDEDTFDKIDESIRQKNKINRVILVLNPTNKKHWIYEKFYKTPGVKYDFCGVFDGVTYIHTTYRENLENLAESFIEKAEKLKLTNLKKYNNRFGGEWIDEVEGALWNDAMINKQRVQRVPDLKRIIISVDPSGTGNADSDDCGIICMGMCPKGDVYIFDDQSGIYTPLKWANRSIYLHEKLQADCLVAEVNQGWDMVHTIIHQIEPKIKVEEVVAKRGKYLRAEPIQSLYEQGRVFHVGNLVKLENEMTSWTPDEDYSPGRLDAMVHGVTFLFKPKKAYVNAWG